MSVVDSSCWLEYFAGSNVGDSVAGAIEDISSLVVPSITLYEVFKKLLSETNEDQALTGPRSYETRRSDRTRRRSGNLFREDLQRQQISVS
ncbi:MAG: PIN domain-containing protein [Chlorobium sp.]|jgi:hypothetical protein|nr:PIN domain-containing protein [Pelodictyon phaeoclathratiforme]MBV5329633.1 PIN domain-containing protein [Chlorobium sp.]